MTQQEIRLPAALGFTAEMSAWAGDYADDFDWDAIRADYNAELDNLAPEGVTWGWPESGPYCYADVNVDPDEVRARWVEITSPESGYEQVIDFDAIASRHDKTAK